jgi:hypothetical protein
VPSNSNPYVPPRPQEQIQLEAIAARIVDLSRSLDFDLEEDVAGWALVEVWTPDVVVSRRVPMSPGSRGSQTVYTTNTGKVRYGRRPTGAKQPASETPSGEPSQNTLTNPRDPNTPARLTPEERLQMSAARGQVERFFRQAQQENWTNDQFLDALAEEGWELSNDTTDRFNDVRDARAEARRLSEAYPQNAYAVLGADGQYFIMQQELANFAQEPKAPATQKQKPRERFDTGNIGQDPQTSKYRETRDPQTTGSPSGREGRKPQNEVNQVGKSEGAQSPSLQSLDGWVQRARAFAKQRSERSEER